MPTRARICSLIVCLLLTATATGQSPDERIEWNKPVEPFRIIGNVYYVGAAGVSAFLIRTNDGDILLDGGLPETAQHIAQSVKTLGFNVRDIKQLINSHAHFDHGGGLAELKRLTGASLAVSGPDAPAFGGSGRDMPAVRVDRRLKDGDTITLGGTTLTAHLTTGHTKGCTTWTMSTGEGGRRYDVLFHCSTSVVDKLVRNSTYPAIVSDYQRTFAALRAMRADVFLGAHPSFFDMDAKRRKMAVGAPNPFVDPSELKRFNDRSERQFKDALAKETELR
jgi:metallo-beta-lactamase class B